MRARRSRLCVLCAVLCALPGCGSEVPQGGVRAPDSKPVPPPAHFDPADLIPADLDLVVRVDVGRIRSALGPSATASLSDQTADEPLIATALERAKVAWIAVRVADVDLGDRLIVIEGDLAELTVDTTRYRTAPAPHPEVRAYERIGLMHREDVAEILVIGQRAVVFVSPVERDSVRRVLSRGRDAGRGDPAAEGLVSVDYRVARLSPRLERKFPSISALLAAVERVRATATLSDDGLVIESTLQGESAAGARKAGMFLQALRDNVEAPALAELVGGIEIEQIDSVVRVDWTVPSAIVLAAIQPRDDADD